MKMNKEKFDEIVEGLNEHDGLEEVWLLSADGDIIFKNKEFEISVEESKALLKAWKEKEPSLTYQNFRYAILKNDDIQLAAKNISGGKGNIAGSITKDGDYILAHISADTGLILLEWSIMVNKFIGALSVYK